MTKFSLFVAALLLLVTSTVNASPVVSVSPIVAINPRPKPTVTVSAPSKSKTFVPDLPFQPTYCNLTLETKQGGHCGIKTYAGNDFGQFVTQERTDDWNVCWFDDAMEHSGYQYFTFKGIGDIMVEWTAHNQNVGIHGEFPCPNTFPPGMAGGAAPNIEGLCWPLIHFYRYPPYGPTKRVELTMKTWKSGGDNFPEYPDYNANCYMVWPQAYAPNGNSFTRWHCQIPCEGDMMLPNGDDFVPYEWFLPPNKTTDIN